MSTTNLDLEKILRHDLPGPRYTSYPTADRFSSDFKVAAYRKAVARHNAKAVPLSLYLHVPFCGSPCFYCGCNRIITRSSSVVEGYAARLCKEIALQGELYRNRPPVQQLHFGGGTPTSLSMDQFGLVFGALDRHFGLSTSSEREYSIELDPRVVMPETIAGLAALGFNRISVGVQDFDEGVQAAVNRLQSFEQTAEVVSEARDFGIRSIAMDLIYGLPRQSLAGFGVTLDKVVSMAPDRISIYGYAHMPARFKAQARIASTDLPDAALRLQLLQLAIRRLEEAGYVYIGMDHFAKPDDELARALDDGSLHRNFQGYSTQRGADLVGLGVSAISSVGDVYAQNQKSLEPYYAAIDAARLAIAKGAQLTESDLVRRKVIQDLMCRGGVNFEEVAASHAKDFRHEFASELEGLVTLLSDDLIRLNDSTLRVTPAGRYVVRSIARRFDAYAAR